MFQETTSTGWLQDIYEGRPGQVMSLQSPVVMLSSVKSKTDFHL